MNRSASSRYASRLLAGAVAMGRVGYPPVREIQLTTERKTQLLDITAGVREALGSDAEGSAALSTSRTRRRASSSTRRSTRTCSADFEMALEGIVDDGWSWKHVDADGPNAPSHVRASVVGPQVLVPLKDGELALGTYQGIFFCEFDGPRSRRQLIYWRADGTRRSGRAARPDARPQSRP